MSSSSFFLLLFPRLLLLSRTSYGMKQLILPTSKNMAVSIPGKSAFPFSQNGWGHLDQHAAQAGSPTACSPGQCPDACWVFPRRGVLQLMCNLFQCSVTLPVKKCSLMFREAPVFQCAPCCLVTGTTEKSLAPSPICPLPSNICMYFCDRSPEPSPL